MASSVVEIPSLVIQLLQPEIDCMLWLRSPPRLELSKGSENMRSSRMCGYMKRLKFVVTSCLLYSIVERCFKCQFTLFYSCYRGLPNDC